MTLPHYPKDSAGRLLTAKVPTISETATVGEGRHLLQHAAEQFDTVNYLYLVNSHRHLTGVVSIREVLQAPSGERLKTFSPETVVTVRPHTDQERVAHIALRNGLKAVPVVDAHQVFLGVVSSGAILSTLNHEHTEDMLHLAGVSKRQDPERYLLGAGPLTHVFSRLPWLVIGLMGGIGAAFVVRWFEDALRVELLLAAFIPVVIYIADAVSAQTQMLYIRASTIAANLNLRSYVLRESIVNVLLGAVLALLIFFASWWWLAVPLVSTVVGLTVFITVCLVTLVGIGLPWLFYRRGYDPAIASEPITSVVCQLVSLCIYFSIAMLLL
jgi:magnesium transporter